NTGFRPGGPMFRSMFRFMSHSESNGRFHHLYLALFVFVLIAAAAPAQEIPLETCDRLPVVQISISGTKYLFLVDTAATSMLNLKSFPHGNARRVAVTSWSGTVTAGAQEVTITDLAIGHHHFKD